jgi:PST family polysaccharide transporter
MSVLRSIAIGAAWTTGAQWFVQISQFAVSILLARLLLPADYGLVGMALVITAFVALFGNLGLGAALIQKKEIDEETISTAFWATVIAGAILLAVVYVAAPYAAEFYREPRVTDVARVAALGLLFGPMNSIVTSLLERHMRYRAVAALDIATALLGQATAVGFALYGMGVWSLVAGTLVAQATRIPLAFMFDRWTPRLAFNVTRLKELLSFGGYLLAFNFVNFFSRNLDKLIIGRSLGAAQLGYYDMAYQAMLKPLQNVSDTIGRPLFPALASLQGNPSEGAETYRKIVTLISLVTFPAMCGLSAVANDFVLLVLGDRWLPSVPVLQILAIAGAVQSVSSTVGSVYLSQGRSDLMFKIGVFGMVAIGAAFLVGAQWGIVGVASAYTLVTIGIWIVIQHIANGLLALQNRAYWRSLIPAARGSIVMAVAVVAARELLLETYVSTAIRFSLCVAIGVSLYASILFLDANPDVREFRNRALSRLRLRGSAGKPLT